MLTAQSIGFWTALVAFSGSWLSFGAQPSTPVPGPASELSPEPSPEPKPAAMMLLVDDARPPAVTIEWPTRAGTRRSLEATLPYASPTQKQPIGANVAAYAAVGGTRIARGQGHPRGLTVRVGLYKGEVNEPFFEDIAPGASIRVLVEGIRMNQPAYPAPGTVLQHVQFTIAELEACNLGDASQNLFHTADPEDTHTGRLTDADSRRGVLRVHTSETDREAEAQAAEPLTEALVGIVKLERTAPDTFTLDAELPYGLLRHIADPWRLTTPGTFQEPSHFHVELEVLPEGVEPLPVNTSRPAPLRDRVDPREDERLLESRPG